MSAGRKASERLFETNYCAAVARRFPHLTLMWLTPSQVREAVLGYDTLLQHAHGVEVIQFKVPTKRLYRPRTQGGLPCLRIELPHQQVQALRRKAKASKYVRAHFVFPGAFEINEYFELGPDVLDFSYSLDAGHLTGIGLPHRKSGVHLGDFRPDDFQITVRSEPVVLPATLAVEGWRPLERPLGGWARDLLDDLVGLAEEAPTAIVGLYLDRGAFTQELR